MQFLVDIAGLIQSFFSRSTRTKLKVLHAVNDDILFPKYNKVFLFNEYHLFKAKRLKKTRKGMIYLDRNDLLNFFRQKDDFLLVLAVTVDEASDVSQFLLENEDMLSLFHHIIFVNNYGRDIGSYIVAVDWLATHYNGLQKIFIANSSLSFDHNRLTKCIAFMESDNLDEHTVCGLGYGYGPRYYLFKLLHLQSYCLFGSVQAVHLYLSFARVGINKFFLIRSGEIRMSQKWLSLKTKRILILVPNASLLIIKNVATKFRTFDSRFDL